MFATKATPMNSSAAFAAFAKNIMNGFGLIICEDLFRKSSMDHRICNTP